MQTKTYLLASCYEDDSLQRGLLLWVGVCVGNHPDMMLACPVDWWGKSHGVLNPFLGAHIPLHDDFYYCHHVR